KTHGDEVNKGLRIKKVGNAIVTALGGREIHPVNVRVGGFYRAPSREDLAALLPELRWPRRPAAACLGWLSTLPFPELERDYELVALRHPDEYAICEGRIVSSKGIDIDVREYDAHFEESHASWSNALRSLVRGRGSYLCGPLARF